MHWVYSALGQNAQAIEYMQIYLRINVPAVIMYGFIDLQRKWLNNQGKTTFPFLASLVGLMIHPVIIYSTVFRFELGFYGIGIAGAVTNSIVLALMLAISNCDKDTAACL